MKTTSTQNFGVLTKSPVEYLKDVYLSRREKNSSYSLNSYARDLGISKSFLSRIFSGERPLSMKLAVQISAALDLSEAQSRQMLLSVVQASTKNAKISRKVKAHLEQSLAEDAELAEGDILYTTVEIEHFKAMANWHHLALLNIVTMKNFKSQPSVIAKQLGITTVEVKEAIDRLIGLGLLSEVDGALKRSTKNMYFKTHKSEYAVRHFHNQMINKAKEELKNTAQKDFNNRLINGITFSCGKEQIELIKEKIDQFQDEILKLASAGEREELYQMNIQYFPLIKSDTGEQNDT